MMLVLELVRLLELSADLSAQLDLSADFSADYPMLYLHALQ
jgi:hypothetical protein